MACIRSFLPALTCLALLGLAACDRSSEESAASEAASTQAKVRKARAQDASSDMVAAASAATGKGPVELKFNLKQRPQVGQPTELELSLTPTTNLKRLYATFQGTEGLEVRSGGEFSVDEPPAAGVPLSHTVTFVAKRDGIFSVTAVVLSDGEDLSLSRTFSIPVIAGEGLTPIAATAKPQSAPASTTSTQQSGK